MRPKDFLGLVCGILIGAAVAFPVGVMWVSRNGESDQIRSPTTGNLVARDLYSPSISSDRYVRDQQHKVIEGLEIQCRHFGERCAEAEKARRWMDRQQ